MTVVPRPDGPPTSAPTGTPIVRGENVLRQLELRVTRKLDGLLHGDHEGLVLGLGSEPGDAREYEPGDDPRRIDWNLSARTNEIHVRETIADRELEAWVVADRTASLDFGTARCEKRDLVTAAASAVGLLVAHGGNRVGAVVMRGDGTQVIPPRGGRAATMALLEQLDRRPRADGGSSDLATTLETTSRVARRRGLVAVVSDFLTPETWIRPMRVLAARHEVLAIEIVDPRELELPDVGYLTVVDPETRRELMVPTHKRGVRESFAQAAAAQRHHIAEALRGAGVNHLVLRTDRDWLLDIVRFVSERKRARHAQVLTR